MDSSKGFPRGRVRIVGGEWRSRLIDVPACPGLRPTPDRVRETLFNWLGQRIDGRACLDLYAGSGALGFEAASRGAARVVMVENDRAALAALRRSCERLMAQRVAIEPGDALEYVQRAGERFDLVFLDPPFRQNALPALLGKLPLRLAKGAQVYLEAARPVETAEPWRELKRARAGQVSYQLLAWEPA
ncbi:MAG: 16S rRNA (guanine(966)-N(2))-methyltransferase RsmD [Proteobacteria bacterium]|nr:16S rRNA (guanine(966)-N(2))-methyltransferase RsmD [Pseudomonadota bacterium]